MRAVSRARVAFATQNAQTMQNGYQTSYMVKVPRAGSYELQKCINKMYNLRDRIDQRSGSDQLRAVTRRMVTDLECNGTLRGAVEGFNLCAFFHEHDSTAQECVRTFMTVSLPGNAFLHRLDTELGAAGAFCVSTWIPPTRRPKERSQRAQAPMVDAYGFRGADGRVLYLSPFEFYMYWEVVALLPPERDGPAGRTKWTDEGIKHDDDHRHDYGFRLVPGRDYKVVEDDGEE